MEYNTYNALKDLIDQIKITNEKILSLELKMFNLECKLLDIESKVDKVIDITDGVSSSFKDMNFNPDDLKGILQSFGLNMNTQGIAGAPAEQQLAETLQVFRSRLGDLTSKLTNISHGNEKS